MDTKLSTIGLFAGHTTRPRTLAETLMSGVPLPLHLPLSLPLPRTLTVAMMMTVGQERVVGVH